MDVYIDGDESVVIGLFKINIADSGTGGTTSPVFMDSSIVEDEIGCSSVCLHKGAVRDAIETGDDLCNLIVFEKRVDSMESCPKFRLNDDLTI